MPTAVGTYSTLAGVRLRLGLQVADTGDDAAITSISDQVNSFLEGKYGCNRIIAPISSATYVLDGNGLSHIYFPKGIRAVSALTVGDYIGDTLDAVDAADIVLRPLEQDRTPGWPAMYLYLSDHPVTTVIARSSFPKGQANISLTCTAGWAAIPDEITDVALTTAVRAWHATQAGQTDIVGTDEMGRPLVSRFVAPMHWGIIKAYKLKQPQVFGG